MRTRPPRHVVILARSALSWALAVAAAGCSAPGPTEAAMPTVPEAWDATLPPVATFSIVACDLETGEVGIAVQSRFLGVGAVVPWARAGAGAIATQAYANTTYGPKGLELLAQGKSAKEVLELLTKDDPGKAQRQIGIVSAKGDVATFTGEQCDAWAGGLTGEHFCVQGNILAGEEVVYGMAKAFEESDGEDLGEKMIDALEGGQKAGGDKRGMQSAALYIVKEGGGYAGFNDRYRDVRVDDHKQPIEELRRIYRLHKQTFGARRNRGR